MNESTKDDAIAHLACHETLAQPRHLGADQLGLRDGALLQAAVWPEHQLPSQGVPVSCRHDSVDSLFQALTDLRPPQTCCLLIYSNRKCIWPIQRDCSSCPLVAGMPVNASEIREFCRSSIDRKWQNPLLGYPYLVSGQALLSDLLHKAMLKPAAFKNFTHSSLMKP